MMNLLKKTTALVLALGLTHLTVQPAAAAAFNSMPKTVSIETRAGVAALIPSIPALPAVARVPFLGTPEAVIPQIPGAQGALAQMGGEIRTVQSQDPAALAPNLNRHYNGERKLAASADTPVPAGYPSVNPTGLTPSVKAERPSRAPETPRRLNSQSGKVHPALLVVIGVVMAAAIAFGIFWQHGHNKNELWESSKSNQDIVAIEKSRRAGDADTLVKIAKDADARQARMAERIADAKSKGDKKVDDSSKDNIKTAQAYVAFDGIVRDRGEENANAVSKDPAQRIGGQLPSTWKERLAAEEAQAKQSGFEGPLAVQLKGMRAELEKQKASASRFESDIQAFDKQVPSLFGGRIKEQSTKAQKDLAEFKDTELNPEQATYDSLNGAMRQRVSDRLAAGSAEYQSHAARMERLNTASELVSPAVDLARQVDKDLAEMVQHLHSRQANLALATLNENVLVEDTDSQGRVTGHHYEDHSGMFKALAASAGAEARASGASAQAGIKALNTILPTLRKDRTIQDENLTFAIPAPPKSGNMGGGGNVFFDFWIPASWNLLGSLWGESDASSVRANFSGVKGQLEALKSEIDGRKAGEAGWVNKQIDKVLSEQMSQAQGDKK